MFRTILRMTQIELFDYLVDILKEKDYNVIVGKNNILNEREYIAAKGNIPIVLLAHLDTVFSDEWCEYKKKYRSLNCGYYPVVGLLGNMQKADSDFAKKYREGIDNIFYKGYW